jgi:hypothetical protein
MQLGNGDVMLWQMESGLCMEVRKEECKVHCDEGGIVGAGHKK